MKTKVSVSALIFCDLLETRHMSTNLSNVKHAVYVDASYCMRLM